MITYENIGQVKKLLVETDCARDGFRSLVCLCPNFTTEKMKYVIMSMSSNYADISETDVAAGLAECGNKVEEAYWDCIRTFGNKMDDVYCLVYNMKDDEEVTEEIIDAINDAYASFGVTMPELEERFNDLFGKITELSEISSDSSVLIHCDKANSDARELRNQIYTRIETLNDFCPA